MIVLLIAATLLAQEASQRKFEVVSIRSVPPNLPPVMRAPDFTPILPGGRYVDSRANLRVMTALAYNVQDLSVLVGFPHWAESESFSVTAKPAEDFPALSTAENESQVRLMLRTMLADRFHLRLHSETRRGSVFYLEAAKGGVRLNAVAAPDKPPKEVPVQLVLSDASGRFICMKCTLAMLIPTLRVWLRRPIIDRANLSGYYDFNIGWSDPSVADTPTVGANGIGLLIHALETQLGLRLRSDKGPVEHWVVDHVARPSEN